MVRARRKKKGIAHPRGGVRLGEEYMDLVDRVVAAATTSGDVEKVMGEPGEAPAHHERPKEAHLPEERSCRLSMGTPNEPGGLAQEGGLSEVFEASVGESNPKELLSRDQLISDTKRIVARRTMSWLSEGLGISLERARDLLYRSDRKLSEDLARRWAAALVAQLDKDRQDRQTIRARLEGGSQGDIP